jgi:hypothetical protein
MTGVKGRRLGDRVATGTTAQLIDDAGCVTDIRIKDISPSGARIETSYGASVPKVFTLRASRDRKEHRAEVVWRQGIEVGVRFVTEEILATQLPPPVAIATTRRLSMSELRKLAQSPKR